MEYRLVPGGVALVLGLVLSGCVIRADGSHEAPIPDVEMYASTGEALDTVSQAGLLTVRDVVRSRDQYASLLEDIEGIAAEKPDDVALQHQKRYIEKTEAFYESLIPLYEKLKDATADSRPGLTTEIYEAQRAYLEDLVTLDEGMDLPETVAAGFAFASGSSAEVEDIQVAVDLDESAVKQLFIDGNYQEIVAQISEVGQVDKRLSPQGRAIYAMALFEQGLDSEAVRQIQELEPLLLLEPELFDARAMLALKLFAQNERGEAEQVLNRLRSDCDIAALELGKEKRIVVGMLEEMSLGAREVGLLAARKSLEEEDFLTARAFLEEIRDSESPQDVKNRAEWMLTLLATREEATFEKELDGLRAMANMPARQADAMDKLEALKVAYPGERFSARLAAIEGELTAGQKAPTAAPEERLEAARALLNAENYEAAISEFESLYGTPAAAQAKEGRDKAVDLFVHEVREDMARAYLSAQKLSDPQERLSALSKIHERLKTVSQSYPESRLTPKINTNIQVVKAEILRIEPTFFD